MLKKCSYPSLGKLLKSVLLLPAAFSISWAGAQTVAIVEIPPSGVNASALNGVKDKLLKFDGLTVDISANVDNELCIPKLTNTSGKDVVFGYNSGSTYGTQTRNKNRVTLRSGESDYIDNDQIVHCRRVSIDNTVNSEVLKAQVYTVVDSAYHWWEVTWWPVNMPNASVKTVFMSVERITH